MASSKWSALRITSGSSIQSVVSTSLSHLSQTSSGPLVLHTLPFSSSSKPTAPKSSRAGLGKLISVVEIVKREFKAHQKALWRLEEVKEAREGKRAKIKGKKRAREDEGITDQQVQKATTENTIDKTKQKRALLRLYQYNELDYYEQHGIDHPGVDTSDEDSSDGEKGNEKDTEHEQLQTNQKAEAQAQLEGAIMNHVVRSRKRYACSIIPAGLQV